MSIETCRSVIFTNIVRTTVDIDSDTNDGSFDHLTGRRNAFDQNPADFFAINPDVVRPFAQGAGPKILQDIGYRKRRRLLRRREVKRERGDISPNLPSF